MFSSFETTSAQKSRDSMVIIDHSHDIEGNELKKSDKTSMRPTKEPGFFAKIFTAIGNLVFGTPEQREARSLKKAEKQVDDSFVSMMKGLGGKFDAARTARNIETMHQGLKKLNGGEFVSEEKLKNAMSDRMHFVKEDLVNRIGLRGDRLHSMSSDMQLRVGKDIARANLVNFNAERMFGGGGLKNDNDFNAYEGVGEVQGRIEMTLQVLRDVLNIPN